MAQGLGDLQGLRLCRSPSLLLDEATHGGRVVGGLSLRGSGAGGSTGVARVASMLGAWGLRRLAHAEGIELDSSV